MSDETTLRELARRIMELEERPEEEIRAQYRQIYMEVLMEVYDTTSMDHLKDSYREHTTPEQRRFHLLHEVDVESEFASMIERNKAEQMPDLEALADQMTDKLMKARAEKGWHVVGEVMLGSLFQGGFLGEDE